MVHSRSCRKRGAQGSPKLSDEEKVALLVLDALWSLVDGPGFPDMPHQPKVVKSKKWKGKRLCNAEGFANVAHTGLPEERLRVRVPALPDYVGASLSVQ